MKVLIWLHKNVKVLGCKSKLKGKNYICGMHSIAHTKYM